jgi:hypothetical protein
MNEDKCNLCFWNRVSAYYPSYCVLQGSLSLDKEKKEKECILFLKDYSYNSRLKYLKKRKREGEYLDSKKVCVFLHCRPVREHLRLIEEHKLYRKYLIEEIRSYRKNKNEDIDRLIRKGFKKAREIARTIEIVAYKVGAKYLHFNTLIAFSTYLGFILNGVYITQFFICRYFGITEPSLRMYIQKYFGLVVRERLTEGEIRESLYKLEEEYTTRDIINTLSFLKELKDSL